MLTRSLSCQMGASLSQDKLRDKSRSGNSLSMMKITSKQGTTEKLLGGESNGIEGGDDTTTKKGEVCQGSYLVQKGVCHIHIGSEYQASLPAIIPPCERNTDLWEDGSLLVWSPGAVGERKIDEFIQKALDMHGYNREQALAMLYWHKHDIDKAVKDLPLYSPIPSQYYCGRTRMTPGVRGEVAEHSDGGVEVSDSSPSEDEQDSDSKIRNQLYEEHCKKTHQSDNREKMTSCPNCLRKFQSLESEKLAPKPEQIGGVMTEEDDGRNGWFRSKYTEKFRASYTRLEDEAIVKYFMERGGYRGRKGGKVWKRMEIKKTCPGRTWQSMRHRWMKYISKKLGTFRVTIEELEKRDKFTTRPSMKSV